MSIETAYAYEFDSDFSPRYSLLDDEIEQTTESFLSQQEEHHDSRYLCYAVGYDTPMSNAARSVERAVFDEAFGNNSEQMTEEYGPYESSSTFLVAIDSEKKMPAGVIRMIQYSEAGLKSINDLQSVLDIDVQSFQDREGIQDLEKVWDVGTLAVLPEYRGFDNRFEVSSKLYRSLFLFGESVDAQHMVTILDSKALKGLDLLGVPFKALEGTEAFAYLGSEKSFAMVGDFRKFQSSVLGRSEEMAEEAKLRLKNMLNPKEMIRKRIIARIAGSLATGKNIDSDIYI